MKKGSIHVFCLVALSLYLLGSSGVFATNWETPTPNLVEKWVTNSGWIGGFAPSGQALAGWTNQSLVAQLQTRSGVSYATQFVSLGGLTNSSGGRFSGDFTKIEAISFDLQLQNALQIDLYLKSAAGVTWTRQISGLPKNTVSGQCVNVTIPLDGVAPWWSDFDPYASFASDKSNVVEIGIGIWRDINNNDKIQQVVMDNAKLIGPWNSFTADGVSLAWLVENNLSEGQALLDTDGDGYSNVAEFLAGTDPNSSNSFFTIQIGRNDQGKAVVKWKDNKYMTFDLLESSDLKAGFAPISGPAGILGSGTEQVVEVGDNVTGSRFYKVQIRAAK